MENVEKQLETVLGRFGIAPKKGETKWMVRCPAHDDHNPSLSITLDENTKRLLIHCHAGCATEKVLSSVGLISRELDFSRLKDQEILTLASLSEKKGLPVDYLKNLCWADRKNSGIVIPYMDEMGVVVLNRRRVDWKQFRWEGVTADPLPYGLDRLN